MQLDLCRRCRIAAAVFRESVRDKVLYNLVLFAVLLIAASLLLGQLTAGQEVKIIKDLGLAAISIFGLFIAIFIGIGLVSKEVERRSIYALLAKPMTPHRAPARQVLRPAADADRQHRGDGGRALSRCWPSTDADAAGDASAAWEAPAIDPALLKAALLILVELALVTAIALLFSTFTSPVLAAALHLRPRRSPAISAPTCRNFEQVVDSRRRWRGCCADCTTCCRTWRLRRQGQVVHAQPVSRGYIALTAGYGVALYRRAADAGAC